VFREIDLTTGKPTKNEDATYLLTRAKHEICRYSDDTLAIYFQTSVNVINNKILLQLKELGVEMTLLLDCDGECVYLVAEEDLDLIHKVLHIQVKGKNIKPDSVRTTRRLVKS
jgi:hypothetical protein